MTLLVRGASTDEMATELGVSTHTVRTHVQSVMRKLGVNSRTKAASMGVALGLSDRASPRCPP
jgi:DNA-binding CsgD family transcriptional regulator